MSKLSYHRDDLFWKGEQRSSRAMEERVEMKPAEERTLHVVDAHMLPFTALVERAVDLAMDAIRTGDQKATQTVALLENEIDDLQKSVEQWSYQELPSQLPIWGCGDDVRYLAALVPITLDLERISNEAADLAQLAQYLYHVCDWALLLEQRCRQQATLHNDDERLFGDIIRRRMQKLGQKVQQMVRATMQAVALHDVYAAQTLLAQDLLIEEIEARISRTSRVLLKDASTQLVHEGENWCIVLQLSTLDQMAQKMERMVIHCRDICERLLFIAGHVPEHSAR